MSITRLDKNIAQNAASFNQYGSDEVTILNLTLYLCFLYQKNKDLFQSLLLDPNDFAKRSGYSKSTLQKRLVNPDEGLAAQLKKLSTKQLASMEQNNPEELFLNVFENGLYRMATEPLILNYKGFSKNGDTTVTVSSVKIIDELRMVIDKKNRNKKFYHVRMDPSILDNMGHFFSVFNYDSYTSCAIYTKKLYLFLCHYKTNAKNGRTNLNLSFSMFCELCDVTNWKEPTERKRKIEKAFNDAIKCDPDLNLCLDWATYSANDNYEYKPLLLETVPIQASDVTQQNKVIYDSIFDENYIRLTLTQYTLKYYPDAESLANQQGFRNAVLKEWQFWANDTGKDLEFKSKCYRELYAKTFKNFETPSNTQVNKYLKEKKFDVFEKQEFKNATPDIL
ncbi:MAG: hypothetical protein H7329_10670 [Opitutaceae bacterium]|nr:hypothetical protein [Cytophagales bacterium]